MADIRLNRKSLEIIENSWSLGCEPVVFEDDTFLCEHRVIKC